MVTRPAAGHSPSSLALQNWQSSTSIGEIGIGSHALLYVYIYMIYFQMITLPEAIVAPENQWL